ncbi:MAG: class I SAM-dependent methyltransferase [Bacteroidota bacterium]
MFGFALRKPHFHTPQKYRFPALSHIPFINRLRKNIRHFSRWARKQRLEAYRIYDADLDEYPCTIDIYGRQYYIAISANKGPAKWQELGESGQQMEIGQALQTALSHFSNTENVGPTNIHFKTRKRQRGEQQYNRLSQVGDFHRVREKDLLFWVNLTDYLDTGLFLDHRQSRQMVASMAAGKSLLNLFAYTCSFSVYAAAAAASSTLSLDLSEKYLNWGQRNMKLNELAGKNHRFQQLDVLAWLEQKPTELYDIIVLDPPTFSNSKSMKTTLDVQRDHVKLIEQCMSRLTPDGTLFFSTNHRSFKLSEEELSAYQIKETTKQTLPPDFRKGKIHQSWLLKPQD